MLIGICENNFDVRKVLYDYILRLKEENNREYIIHRFDSVKTLLKDNEEFDLLLLDVKLEGVESVLKTYNKNAILIFIADYYDNKDNSFLNNAFRYIIKSILMNSSHLNFLRRKMH